MAADAERLRDLLRRGLAELRTPEPDPEVVERLASLAELVARWTRRVDLTGHRTAEAVARRLVLGALALARAVPDFQTLADLGSGAGFPGLPIAIERADRSVTLVDSRERRHHFQRAAIRALGIANARALHGRAEELPAEPHDLVVAQAIGESEAALGWMLRWVRPGGAVALPGARKPGLVPAVEVWTAVDYEIPLGARKQVVWIGRVRTT